MASEWMSKSRVTSPDSGARSFQRDKSLQRIRRALADLDQAQKEANTKLANNTELSWGERFDLGLET